MKRVAHYRDRYLNKVFATPWLALKRHGCYRDLRLKILRLALPHYFQWEIEVLREELDERLHYRFCCFPYLNCVVELCPELPFGDDKDASRELRLIPIVLKPHSFLPSKLMWNWVHPYATDI